jgi:hypothetical protein
MGKTIFYDRMRITPGFHMGLFIVLMLSTPLMAQFQGDENTAREPQYNVSSERFFTDPNGIILMNVNVWGHVNVPGRHMVFDGIDLATLLSVVGGPMGGANLKMYVYFERQKMIRENFSIPSTLKNSSNQVMV